MIRFLSSVTFYIKASAWGFCFGITICDLFGSVAKVNGVSMQPTLNPASEKPKDWIFFNTWKIRDYKFERGDIVCLTSPRDPKEKLIKRIIGLEGDVIRTLSYKNSFLRVPEGHCWVEGDHHSQSMDSNFFGPVPLALVIGKATHIIWPPNRWSSLSCDLPVGSIFKNAIALGDVDNDGMHELVVANQNGDLSIFKGSNSKIWRRAADLGMVTAVGIGDIFNKGRNSLVVVNGEGWCYIFDFPASSERPENSNADGDCMMKPCHVQRIPANTKVLLLHDVNGDGLVELVIGLTDRVVRTYQWTHCKLVGLNKWEFVYQIGTVTINDMANRTPSLLVAHPGGRFIRLKCKPPDNLGEQHMEEQGELLSKLSIDFHPLAYSHMRNPKVSTEILGNISQGAGADASRGSLYAVATLDGTLMLVQDEQILWSFQVDHQLFALSKLDITGDGREEVVACSWDGHTYIINQEKQSVRFQFDHSVGAFCAGHFSLKAGENPSPALVYATFSNKIYVYYNVTLPRITLNTLTDVVESESPQFRQHPDHGKCLALPSLMRELVSTTLYGHAS